MPRNTLSGVQNTEECRTSQSNLAFSFIFIAPMMSTTSSSSSSSTNRSLCLLSPSETHTVYYFGAAVEAITTADTLPNDIEIQSKCRLVVGDAAADDDDGEENEVQEIKSI